ncbi:MAG TPA: site-2 protease family protein, partial [Methanomassiliicoccales archaeon]|nr:site-2 protease family protein [Methanomassiliicoccales archaeon]
ALVAKHFSVYEVLVNYDAVRLMVRADESTLGGKFEDLRKELKQRDLIPFLNYSGGEHSITVLRSPPPRKGNLWINRALLTITFMTTTLAGTLLWADYSGAADWLTAGNVAFGALFFALPLMSILGVHELSHYIASKRHGVDASLPYFIPSIPPLGTFGAFISMRDPIPDRRSLVIIGSAGPIGGLLVTIPVSFLGLWLTSMGDPASGMVGDAGAIAITIQPLYALLAMFIPLPENVTLHPTAFAAWVGFLVTAINLLPAGQLDGGHVARGLAGDKAKYLSYATVALLLVLGLFYMGWLIFAMLILFLGLRHPAPLNDITPLDRRTMLLGVVTLGILLVTFSPIPLVEIAPDHSFDVQLPGGNETVLQAGTSTYFYMHVNNTGNTNTTMRMNVMQVPAGWSASLFLEGEAEANATDLLEVMVPYDEGVTVVLKVSVPPSARTGTWELLVDIRSFNSNGSVYQSEECVFTVTVE